MAICYEYKGQSFESKKDLQRFMMEEYIRENSSVPTPTEETQVVETTLKDSLTEEQQLALDQMQKLYPEIKLSFTEDGKSFEAGDGKVVMNQKQLNEISYTLKAVDILQSSKAEQVFKKGKKNNWDLNKILTELQIPKEQKKILLSKTFESGYIDELSFRENLIISLLSDNSFVVEINTAKKLPTKKNIQFSPEENQYEEGEKSIPQNRAELNSNGRYTVYLVDSDGNEFSPGNNYTKKQVIEEFGESLFDLKLDNTQYYSNLTVPGGTNYTENEITTPAITPNIKGHSRFSTDRGIGWFRSDETTDTKTRRILEVQSDLFQKGRNKDVLVSLTKTNIPNGFEFRSVSGQLIKKEDGNWYKITELIGVTEKTQISEKEVERLYNEDFKISPIKLDEKSNQFLQLLNKKNNWVTFFVKSIIQDSAKKGYDKVLFPKGNTAAKIEGLQTLEEFKKQKEARIKELENKLADTRALEAEVMQDLMEAQRDEYLELSPNEQLQEVKNGINNEIKALKQELADVESGKTQLSSIANFYENTITNILKKNGYKLVEITDEYGNSWNEIEISEKQKEEILLQKDDEGNIKGQANIDAMTVLFDKSRLSTDTIYHEYAHHYIAWNREAPIVKEAIKKWGSEEALVQAIGEQAEKQKGKAFEWFLNFIEWLKGGINKLSDKDAEELKNILTDAFLTRAENKQLGLVNKPTPQTETTEDFSQLSMDELRAKFAEAYKSNDASKKSAFAPTEEIFNRGNKASNSYMSNFFAENSDEFFSKLVSLLNENNFEQSFIVSNVDNEMFAKELLKKTTLKATKNLVDSDSLVDVFRALGLLVDPNMNYSNAFEYKQQLENFTKLSLADKIDYFENTYPDTYQSFGFILSFFSRRSIIDPSRGMYYHTVQFKNPGDKITMDQLMSDFEDILFSSKDYQEENNLDKLQMDILRSIAKDLILYDIATSNLDFGFGSISKIYNFTVASTKFKFLNQSMASVFEQRNLSTYASTVTLQEMYDQDPTFIPQMNIPYNMSVQINDGLGETNDYYGDVAIKFTEDKDRKVVIAKSGDPEKPAVIRVISRELGNQYENQGDKLPSNIKVPSNNGYNYYVKYAVKYDEQLGSDVAVYFLSGYGNDEKTNNLSKVKKTTGKNILNDQFQPHLGSLNTLSFDEKNAFIPNGNFVNQIADKQTQVQPNYFKISKEHSLNKIRTTGRSRNLDQIKKDGNKLKSLFEKAGVKVNLEYNDEIDSKGEMFWNGEKEVTITINPSLATDDTSPHEFSHIFADIVGVDHPIMKKAISFLKGTKLWREVAYNYPHLKGDALAKEVISTAMGIAAAKKLNKEELSTWQKIKQGIKAFFKRLFRFKSMNPVDELVEMMYNEDLSGYVARFNLEDNIQGWQSLMFQEDISDLEAAELDRVYNFSSDKVIDKIFLEIENKRATLRKQGRPTRFIDKTIKKMKDNAGDFMEMVTNLLEYHHDLLQRTMFLSDYVNRTMDLKVRNGNLTSEEEVQLSNAMYELSDNLKTIKQLYKNFTPYMAMKKSYDNAMLTNKNLLDGDPNKKTEQEIIDSLFDSNTGLLKGETDLDILSYLKGSRNKDHKFKMAMAVANMAARESSISRIETELYGDGANREGILKEYFNRQLIPLSSNPDFVEGEIKSLFKLRKTRYTLPYDETTIQLWLDALKDTNNPFVALAVKKYYEGLFMAKKRSQEKIRQYKKRVEKFKSAGHSMDSLVDSSGRFIDEIDYEKYLEIRERYLVNKEGSYAEFHMKYHTWHPDYDKIKQDMIDTYGENSEEYLEWYNANHGETKKGKIYPKGSMSVPNAEVKEIRNKDFDRLSKSESWLEFRNYLKELVRSQKGSMYSQLLDEGFIPAVPLKGDSIIEEIKSNADGFKESVKKLGKHFKGKFLPNVEEDAENKQYIITDEDNNIVDTVPIPFLKFLSKKEKPVFDSSKKNSRKYLAEFRRQTEKYNIDKRREQGALVNNNLELTMEVFIGMTETYNYKKQQTSSLLLMRELVKANPLHRNKGLLEVLDLTTKKTTGKDAPSLTEATNLLEHVDRWLKMVHYDKFDFADQDWQKNIARVLMSITSISALGLNAFSAFNNVAYGNIQLFAERMAGEFFTTKSWKRASAIANKLPFYNFSTKPDDKDASIANFFDVVERGKELGDKKGGAIKEDGAKEKIINSLFFMQNAGEIQMQNATLFSVLMETPVKVTNEDGTTTDGYLYDYMQNVEGNIFVPENVKVKSENGKWVTADDRQLARIRGKVYSINQYMHGIYNKEDAGTVNMSWIGRLGTHFKKWMRPGFNRRFGSRFWQAFWNETRESLDEGMYVSTFKFLWGAIKNAKTQESMSYKWDKLDVKQKSNIIRTGVEMSAALSLAGLAFVLAKVIEGLEPEDDEYLALYAMHYMTQRLYREQLTYSFRANTEAKRTIQAPIASWRMVGDTVRSLGHVMGIPFAGTFMEDIFGNPYYQAGYKKGEHKGLYKLKQMIPLAKTFMQYKALDDTFEIRKQQ